MVVVEEMVKPHIAPAEKILSIELFPGKEGFATKIGGRMDPKIEEGIIACVRRNANVFAFQLRI